jgi:hypothetical protein
MKKNVFFVLCLCLVSFWGCSKYDSNIISNQSEVLEISTGIATQTNDCTVENCQSDPKYTPPSGTRCHENGTQCADLTSPYSETLADAIAAESLMKIIKKPTGLQSDDLLFSILNGTYSSQILSSNELMNYNIKENGKSEILYQKTLIRDKYNQSIFTKAGNPSLSVTQQALDNYKKTPSLANKKIILAQVFGQLSTTYFVK